MKGWVIVTISLVFGLGQAVVAADAFELSQEWNAIVREHVDASNAWTKGQSSKNTERERETTGRVWILKEYELGRRALAVAEAWEARGDSHVASIALNHVLTNPHDDETGARAAELAIAGHRDRLPELCQILAWGVSPSAASEPIFRAVLEDEDPAVRGPTMVHFAEYLRRRSEESKQTTFLPEYEDDLGLRHGPDYARHVAAPDGEADEAEAQSLLEKALSDHTALLAGTTWMDRPLDEIASEQLRAVSELSIGKLAPAIEGADVSGRRFTSHDYAGKVRVLYFWGHWCGGCRAMYPKATAMGEMLRDEPFAFLGINSDAKRETVEKLVAEGALTFPVWFDGGQEGPIGKQWLIIGAPHTVVIDAEGRIRWKSGARLDQVVRKLLDEAKSGK
jgi:thiol-disulfide isomerase/thioredoxin